MMSSTVFLGICESSAIHDGGKPISCITLANIAAVGSVCLPLAITLFLFLWCQKTTSLSRSPLPPVCRNAKPCSLSRSLLQPKPFRFLRDLQGEIWDFLGKGTLFSNLL